MELADMESLLLGRSWFYRLFAQCLFAGPDAAGLRPFAETETAVSGGGAAAEAFAAELILLRRYGADEWRALREEHERLFAGAGPVLVCPWESAYTSRERIIFDEHTAAVQEIYAAWGAAASNRRAGPADHIGIECGFLALLAERTAAALADGDTAAARRALEAQQRFLAEHVLLFADAFCARLREAAVVPFYRTLASFLAFYLREDAAFLRELLAEE